MYLLNLLWGIKSREESFRSTTSRKSPNNVLITYLFQLLQRCRWNVRMSPKLGAPGGRESAPHPRRQSTSTPEPSFRVPALEFLDGHIQEALGRVLLQSRPRLQLPAADAALPVCRVFVLRDFAVAGAILAHPLSALGAGPAEVVRLEGFQTYPAGPRSVGRLSRLGLLGWSWGWLLFGWWGVDFRWDQRWARTHFGYWNKWHLIALFIIEHFY